MIYGGKRQKNVAHPMVPILACTKIDHTTRLGELASSSHRRITCEQYPKEKSIYIVDH